MPPVVLVIEPESERRKELSRGLSALGYEVITTSDERQGWRFAHELGGSVVVAPVGFLNSGPPAPPAGAPRAAGSAAQAAAPAGADALAPGSTLLLLGAGEEEGQDLPETVFFLAAGGLRGEELVERIHLLVLGREIGIEPDSRLESLVGDLALVPLLELLRALQRGVVSGRLVLAKGEIVLDGGDVVAAVSGATRGVKAFCRLSHVDSGPVRIVVGRAAGAAAGGGETVREIRRDLTALIIEALEDKVHDAPDAHTRARIELGPAFFGASFTPLQKELLAALPASRTVGRLLDVLPASDGAILRELEELTRTGIVIMEEPEAAVRVVTDSTCDLPAELARANGLEVVPLMVFFGQQVFHDGIDLRPREFYERLERDGDHPRTNPPLKGDFLKTYGALVAHKDLVSIHLSEKLSQTIVHARAAASEGLPEFRRSRAVGERAITLRVVDSASVSLGLGLLALFAARMARRGLEPDDLAARLEAMRERVHVLFVVDTLDYLARGGRIGKARAVLGNLLGIKPILGLADGEVVPVDRVRGGRAAHPRLIELFRERIDPARPVAAGIGHAKAPVWADRLRALLEQNFRISELLVTEIGPVVGTHAGPGTVGAALFQPADDEAPLIAPLRDGD
ncbi:MAG TPA: DegV family protein [Thermoanaerobaculia bacterium]|nr:DegV family protein [Thermoanaerobaculia bacterium]